MDKTLKQKLIIAALVLVVASGIAVFTNTTTGGSSFLSFLFGQAAPSGIGTATATMGAEPTLALNAASINSSVVKKPATAVAAKPSVAIPAPAPPQLRVLIAEVMMGSKDNRMNQFIVLYNPNTARASLVGWTIKKTSSTGSVSTFVSGTRLASASIPAQGYVLIGRDGGYTGAPPADILWPASYTLASKNNAITLYNKNGDAVDTVSWTSIPDGKSYVRLAWDSTSFIVQDTPTPKNSTSN